MAGKIRLKVSPEHAEPFWMFVNTEESPLIVNVQESIEQRLKNGNVANLYLDGCLLPAGETSELLRDNDTVTVHVILTKCEEQLGTSTSSQHKKHRKRKLSNKGEHSVSENQAGLIEETLTTPDIKKKKKSRKEKPVNEPEGCKDQKEKEKKCKKKEKAQQSTNGNSVGKDDGLLTPVPSVLVTTKKGSETQHETSIGTPVSIDEASKVSGIVNSTPLGEVTDSSAVEKRKRRRSRKKKAAAKSQSETNEDSAQTKKPPAEVRLPKWQQAQNKKIVFSSGGESADESGVSINQVNSEGAANLSHDVLGSASFQPGVGVNNSSYNEHFPSTHSLNLANSSHDQSGMNKDDTGDAGTEAGSTTQVLDVHMFEDVNGSASVDAAAETEKRAEEECREDGWYRDQQYQQKLTKERNGKRRCPSALNESVTPVHQYSGGHEVVQPNLLEHLKMSPEERGVTVPPNVTATRLSNGAMLYTRSRAFAGADKTTPSSPFRRPATCAPAAKASSHTPSKQQQLQTVNTNKSLIIQNPPASRDQQGSTGNRNGTCPTEEGEMVADSRDTIILTPVGRDYSLFADLTAAPKVGDQIAFKVLEMGENYTPGISDYKEAEVLEYDASTQTVRVRHLHLSIKKKTPGKFDLPDESLMEEEEMLELSSMFEPKLISSQ